LASVKNHEGRTHSELQQLLMVVASSAEPGSSRNEAFELLYQRIYPKVCRRVGMLLREAGLPISEREHIANGILFRVYQAIRDGRYDANRPFNPWLFRITDHLVIDWMRVQHPVVSIDSVEAAEPAAAINLSEDPEQQELSNRLHAVLDSLPEDERLVMQLHYLEDLTIAAIEQRLKKTNGAVRGLLDRAKQRLRRKFPGSFGTN
jgi:RNA polymerase sigma-70 factor (ECF subfamily)